MESLEHEVGKPSPAGERREAPKRLGERLVEAGLITREQLRLALEEQKRLNEPLGQVLIELGFISEATRAEMLAAIANVPFVSLRSVTLDVGLLHMVPAELAKEHLFVPIKREPDGSVTVAMANPTNVVSIDAIREALGAQVNVVAALEHEILSAISTMREAEAAGEGDTGFQGGGERVSGGALDVVEVVDRIIDYGVRNQATDIHIEPERGLLRIRYRMDGMLHPGETLPVSLTSAVITRIKVLAKMDITERRKPQDGRITLQRRERRIDLRISTMPTAHGENVVIRILDKGSVSLDLKALGMDETLREQLTALLAKPYGMILVSGPTGSGKTTTLYSLLTLVDAMTRKVVTVEDPIEYELPLIRQSQVDTAIGYGFAEGLRTILRQDPDVVLVGEIRDRETADVALRASLTGHVVMSSIHTNTAVGAVPRLLDLGIEPFLISSSLSAVIGQRLVRRLCDECKQAYEASEEEAEWLGVEPGTTLYKPDGCPRCRGTGYAKRTGIFEVFTMDPEYARMISEHAGEAEIMKAAKAKGMKTMLDDGKAKVLAGITSIQEVLRVSQ